MLVVQNVTLFLWNIKMFEKLNYKLKQAGFQLLMEREAIILKFIVNLCKGKQEEQNVIVNDKIDDDYVESLKRDAEQRYNLLELNNFKWCENQGINPNTYGRVWFYYTYVMDKRQVFMDKIHVTNV